MLAVIPIRDGILPAGGAETIGECAGRAVLIGSQVDSAARDLDGIASHLQLIETPAFAPAAWADALSVLSDDQIVLPASADGRDLAPRLAAVLQRPLFAGAIAVSPTHVALARRGGLVLEDVHPTTPFVATLQPGVRGVERNAAAPPTSTTLHVAVVPSNDVSVIEVLPPDTATMDLSEAKRIVGGGAGLTTPAAFADLSKLADRLNASMGATRVITDRGWIGHERQIGTTGVVVDPQLYIAFGISGAVQHTSGLGQPEHIISINTDPHCPMMQLADLAIVADADAVVTELIRQLGEHV